MENVSENEMIRQRRMDLKLTQEEVAAKGYRILNGTVVKWYSSHDPFGDGWQIFAARQCSAVLQDEMID